ncbi:type II toxin-antitoxin system ParD family antitoxin [Massilia violaceinigra]|uniref:Type II toxin-antitoxin system ParD family antitoxin n=1 Tax=Massilia violaceinigra TaxID=2045208 RepID=A0ABY4A0V0_9BURK|nr:type II toxin-antitoxin system ParD family antitoxin [Massilia violaceinigra]UOD28384.1 type II toxin-antitoxin system ParD family antitoxin [Massilia violaceinigra]
MDMKIVLAPQFEEMVREKLASGLYASPSDVVHDALRLMLEHDQKQLATLVRLRKDIQDGLSSGPAVEWDADDIIRAGHLRRGAKVESGA